MSEYHDNQPETPGNDEDAAVAKRRQALRRLAVYGGLTSAFMVTSLSSAKAQSASPPNCRTNPAACA